MQDRPDSKARTLYDTDFVVWCNEQARLVRERRFGELDIENVAEELESVGRNDTSEIRSRLKVLLAHLLKWKYQPGARSQSWRRTIRDQRAQIAFVIEDSPSLRTYPEGMLARVYETARALAAEETGIDFTLFPDACPFTAEQILDPDFLPREPDSYKQD